MGEASGKAQTPPCPSQAALVGARRRCIVSAARGEVIVVALRRRHSLPAQRLGLAFVQQAIALPPRVMHGSDEETSGPGTISSVAMGHSRKDALGRLRDEVSTASTSLDPGMLLRCTSGSISSCCVSTQEQRILWLLLENGELTMADAALVLSPVVKIWDYGKPVPLSILKPHDGQAVYSVTFLTAPERPNHTNLITAGSCEETNALGTALLLKSLDRSFRKDALSWLHNHSAASLALDPGMPTSLLLASCCVSTQEQRILWLLLESGARASKVTRAEAALLLPSVDAPEHFISRCMLLPPTEPEGCFFEPKAKRGSVDADRSTMTIHIFLRHASGELAVEAHLDEPLQNLMRLYAQRTNTMLGDQYLVYGNTRLEPAATLLFYGVERDATVHVRTRLRGGAPISLADYVSHSSNSFTKRVVLPDGQVSLQMTILGCQFLSSWTNCLTTAFAKGCSWNGAFTLDGFKFIEGHVLHVKKPKKAGNGSMRKDVDEFLCLLEEILCNANTSRPPYLDSYIRYWRSLRDALDVTNLLANEDKLFLGTHVCLMTSYAREKLIFELYRKYEGADREETSVWNRAINGAICSSTWHSDLPSVPILMEVFEGARKLNCPYPRSKIGAFRFMKDIVTHAEDYIDGNFNARRLGAAKELMIPAHLKDFLPSIIMNLIKNNVDISEELLAAIKCSCTICDSSH